MSVMPLTLSMALFVPVIAGAVLWLRKQGRPQARLQRAVDGAVSRYRGKVLLALPGALLQAQGGLMGVLTVFPDKIRFESLRGDPPRDLAVAQLRSFEFVAAGGEAPPSIRVLVLETDEASAELAVGADKERDLGRALELALRKVKPG